MSPPTKALSRTEFVALMAMLVATVAFSIDAMLPAFPEIASELTPDAPNKAQLIIASFVLGMGIGTLFVGPLADAFGRKTIMVCASGLFIIGALLAYIAPSLELLLIARLIQGLGAAGPRIATLALIRDLYSGRDMAQILSFVFMIFSLIPAFAPAMGHYIIEWFDWRSIFLSFVLFSIISCSWLTFRQPETLPAVSRRPLRVTSLIDAVKQVFIPPATRLSIMVQTLTFGMLFTTIQTIQPVFDGTFGMGDNFHLWFGGMALVGMTSSMLNAWLVVRTGMRAILRTCYLIHAAIGLAVLVGYTFADSDTLRFVLFLLMAQATFYFAGLTLGNLNALALEPLGHIAGTASSVISAISTVGGILIAVPVSLAFNGTPIPWAMGVVVCATLAYLLSRMIVRPGD